MYIALRRERSCCECYLYVVHYASELLTNAARTLDDRTRIGASDGRCLATDEKLVPFFVEQDTEPDLGCGEWVPLGVHRRRHFPYIDLILLHFILVKLVFYIISLLVKLYFQKYLLPNHRVMNKKKKGSYKTGLEYIFETPIYPFAKTRHP